MEYQTDMLVRALSLLYLNQAPKEVGRIDEYLKGFSKSKQAWQTSFGVLETEGYMEAVYIFCGITLKYKLLYDFEEVPETDKFIIKNKLLLLCRKYAKVLTVLRQLGLCLGILSIHLAGEWNVMNEVDEVVKDDLIVFLELIKAIAEGVSDKDVVEDGEKANIVRKELRDRARDVIFTVIHCEEEAQRAMEVFVAWMRIGVEGVIEGIEGSEMLKTCWDILERGENVESAYLVVCEMIELSVINEYQNLAIGIWESLIRIWPKFQVYLQDSTMSYYIVNLYTKFAIYHIKQVAKCGNFQVFYIMIELSKVKNADCVEELVRFWHKTGKVYLKLGISENLENFFLENLEKILKIFIENIQLDEDQITSGVFKETGEIRLSYLRLFKEFCNLFSSFQIFNWLKNYLIGLSYDTNMTQIKYSQIEAVCMYISPLLSLLYPTDNSVISIIDLFTSQLWSYSQLNTTICSIFENLSFSLPLSTLQRSFNFILSCLYSGINSEKISLYFSKLCINNSASLCSYKDVVLGIQASCRVLSESAQDLVLEGISSVFWEGSLSSDGILEVIQPYTSILNVSIDKGLVLYACDRIGIIFKVSSLHKSIPLLPVYNNFKTLWPTFQDILNQTDNFVSIPESICRILKYTIKKLGHLFNEFLTDLMDIIQSQYTKYQHPCFLYLIEQLVKLHPKGYTRALVSLLENISQLSLRTLRLFDQTPVYLELTEDYFAMVNKYLAVYFDKILFLPCFPQILACGISAIGVQDTDSGLSIYKFLRNTLEICTQAKKTPNESIRMNIYSQFQLILFKLLEVIINIIPSGLSDIVLELTFLILSSQKGYIWLESSLNLIPPDCLNHEEIQKFKQSCLYSLNLHSWIKKLHKRSKNRALRLR